MGITSSCLDPPSRHCPRCGTTFHNELEKETAKDIRQFLQGLNELAQAAAEKEREETRQMKKRGTRRGKYRGGDDEEGGYVAHEISKLGFRAK